MSFTNSELSFAYPQRGGTIGWADRDQSLELLSSKPLSTLKELRPSATGFIKNKSRRFASVELEFRDYKNASKLNKAVKTWNCSIVHDASMLREEYGGEIPEAARVADRTFEINSAPACGDALYLQIKDLTDALEAAKASITIHCGTHVHVDCRDHGYQDIQKLIKVYSAVEDTLFSAVHWTRRGNQYCLPCGQKYYEKFIEGIKPDTKGLKAAIIKGVYGDKALASSSRRDHQPVFHDLRGDHYGRIVFGQRNPARYSALNLHTYFLRGTVEFRLHHGSYDCTEIYGWAKMLVNFIDAVYKTPDSKLQELIKSSNFQGKEIMKALLPADSFQYLDAKMKMLSTNPKLMYPSKVLPCQLAEALASSNLMPFMPMAI